MKREMKYSGVAWIGEIPKEWEVCRIKNVANLYNGNSIKDEEKAMYTDKTDAYPYISTKDIDVTFQTINYENGLYTKKDDSLFRIANSNSILMCIEGGSAGKKKAFLEQDVSFVNKLCCFSPDKINGKYLFHYICSPSFETEFNKYITGLIGGVSISIIKDMFISFPPIEEQQKIAEFLDRKCGEIDEMIALQEKVIEELKAYKQSIITEAVTKGLNPNVAMRDSEILFIDKIPKHWEETKTLRLLSMPITDGPHETPEGLDYGIPFISADAVSDNYINFDNKWGYISQEYYKECCKKYTPQKYDIYMIKSGASTGRTAIVETDEIFTIWSPLAVFRANTNIILPYFLLYVLRSDYYQKQVENKWSFGTQQNIGMRVLEKLLISYPSIEEQKEIAEFLDRKCNEIDRLIEIKGRKIDELKEYKKSLIYEYVTGKKEI